MEEKVLGKVYMIVSPSGKKYVGSTTVSFKKRWDYYYKLYCKTQIKLYRSLKKYDPENHTFLKIWEGDTNEMLKQEAILGHLHKVIDEGLNLKLPKINDVYKCVSDETKKKISIASSNRSIESINKSRESALKRSPEIYKRISKTLTGRKQSVKQIKNAAETRWKIIIQMDLDNNFIKEWKNTLEIKEELGFNQESIRRVCRKERQTYKKFKWEYKDGRTV
jgi:group I intron endonuclease